MKKLNTILKYVFFLGLGIFLIWWSLHQIPDEEYGKFKEALRSAHYWMIVPVFLILAGSHVVRALRWRLLMEPMGYMPSLPNTFFAVMIGYLANLAVPRLGEVLKCTILARYEKVPAEKIVGTIVAERAFDVLCLGIIFIMALIFQFDVVMNSYQNVKTLTHAQAMAQAKEHSPVKTIVLIIIAIVVFAVLLWLFLSKKWKPVFLKVKKIILGIWEGLISASKLQHKKTFIVYSVLIWLFYIGGTWIGLYATNGTGLGFKEAVSCLAFGSIGMIVTPGGIGAYAYLIAKVLEENGVDYALGIANGTLQWFAQTIIVLGVGFICLGLLPVYNKTIAHEKH
ncbi:MAG: flippase-like domain-containing protein [Sphingobacteriia bacterium]|nr:flippase-like domain-containing protein [Sphingobacteriia bacterium]